MLDTRHIAEIAEECLAGTNLFVVDCQCRPGNEIELVIDGDDSVSLDDCAALNRAVEERLDRETEDFSLTVASAGIGEALKSLRQYRKRVGSAVEALLADGTKILATLEAADEEGITLAYDERVAAEDRKRKVLRHTVRRYRFDELRRVREYLDYK